MSYPAYIRKTRFTGRKLTLPPAPVAGGLLVSAGLLVWQTLILNSLWMFLRSGAWLYTLMIVGAVAGLVMVVRNNRRDGKPNLYLAGGVLIIGCAVVFIGVLTHQSYGAHHGMYQASVTVSGDRLGDYAQRPPFTVAENQTQSHVDINGTLGETTYMPDTQHFGTLVANRGIFAGYGEVIWQTVTDSGQSTANNCQFSSSMTRRFNGPFWSNLQRAIIHKAGPELIDQSDAYAVCTANGDPEIIVPMKAFRGVIYTYQVPDGIAVVDKDGNITIDRDVTAGEYPGPVYPMSLAVKQREATSALGSWWDHVQNRVGYQPTSDNSETNVSEFNLARADGSGADFVTPLTLVGQSQSINAVGVVSSSSNQAGELNPYRVLTLSPPRQANSAVDSRLRADYGNLQGWAAGMSVYEIVPTGPDMWRATIGQPKAIMYYAQIGADGTSCLYSVTDDAKIGCSGDTTTQPGGPSAPGGVDLSSMTDEQLIQLIQQAAAQLQQNQEAGR